MPDTLPGLVTTGLVHIGLSRYTYHEGNSLGFTSVPVTLDTRGRG